MKKTTSEAFDDDDLVKFLQTHSPSTPPEIKPCEELIMRQISISSHRENIIPKKKRDRSKLLWLFPLTLFSGLLMLSNQLLKNSQLSPQIVSNYDEMDSFMINTWHGSMAHETEEELIYINASY